MILEFIARHPEFLATFQDKLEPLKNHVDHFLEQDLATDNMQQPLTMFKNTVMPSIYAPEQANSVINTVDELLTQLTVTWAA